MYRSSFTSIISTGSTTTTASSICDSCVRTAIRRRTRSAIVVARARSDVLEIPGRERGVIGSRSTFRVYRVTPWGFESPRSHNSSSDDRCGSLRRRSSHCHATATNFRQFDAAARSQHREHALIGIIDPARFLAHDFRQLAVMRFGHVDVEHRLVDPLVTEPRIALSA